ncbi:hypothetical protein CARUB_v10006987mg [Capsella rubella]|uniref:C2H2-type domain-containing protein n=2 Tax=Capsella rubella TaxID=81985 RepID=R0GNK7_9BRAS|nr:hypothetical protein CARUB_v10006987mg [Capsella rubella]
MVSSFSMPCRTTQISNFVRVSRVFINQTIQNRYCAIVPTSNIASVQNDNERVMSSDPTIWSSTSHLPNVSDKHYETFTPNPINYFSSQQDSTSLRRFDPYVPKDCRPVKKFHKTLEVLKEIDDYINYEEGEGTGDVENIDWIHNLPYENDGAFICLKCNGLFDTPHILAAHVKFVHYRSDSNEESKKRIRALNHQEVNGKSHKINKDQTGGQSCRRKLRQ